MIFLPKLFPVIQSAGISALIVSILSLSMVIKYRVHIKYKDLVFPIFFFSLINTFVILFGKKIETQYLEHFLGLFLLILAFFLLVSNKKIRLTRRINAIYIGISAVMSGLFGIAGPLMSIYFLDQTDSKESYLGNIQAFFLISALYSTFFRIQQGLISSSHIPTVIIGMGAILIGLFVANKIINLLNPDKLKKIIYLFIAFSGILYLF